MSNSDKKTIQRLIGSLGIILTLVAICYWKIFLGANFILDADGRRMFNITAKGAAGNGWVFDFNFGKSFFMGDFGVHHPWSLFTLLNKLAVDPLLLHTITIFALCLLAAVSSFYFLHKTEKKTSLFSAAYLAAIVAMPPGQFEFYFNRHWTAMAIAAPLLVIVLNEHFRSKTTKTYFYLSLLFFITFFLGSYASFSHTLLIGFVFTVALLIQSDYSKKRILIEFPKLYSSALVIMLCLGAWCIYSFIIDAKSLNWVRTVDYTTVNSTQLLDGPALLKEILSFFHSGLFGASFWLFGPLSKLQFLSYNWSILTPIFIISFVHSFATPNQSLWLRICRGMLIVFFANEILCAAFPVWSSLLIKIFHGYPYVKFQTGYYAFQALIVLAFVRDLFNGSVKRTPLYVLSCLSVLMVYIFPLSIYVAIKSGAGIRLIQFISNNTAFFKESLDVYRIALNAQLLEFSAFHIAYYIVSATLALAMLFPSKTTAVLKHQESLALLLAVNAILMSNALFPLNANNYWTTVDPAQEFSKVDRAILIDGSLVSKAIDTARQRKSDPVAFYRGKRTFDILQDYQSFPAIDNFDCSFQPDFIYDFIHEMYDKSGKRLDEYRQFVLGSEVIESDYLNLASFKYLYALTPKVDPTLLPKDAKHLYSDRTFHLYLNSKAFPYIYATQALFPAEEGLFSRQTADATYPVFLPAKAIRHLKTSHVQPIIQINSLESGYYAIDTQSKSEFFLVVGDSWHPKWKATIDGKQTEIIRTNIIFKGVYVPEGTHDVCLYFDTTDYRFGIYISIGSWSLFLLLAFWTYRRNRNTA